MDKRERRLLRDMTPNNFNEAFICTAAILGRIRSRVFSKKELDELADAMEYTLCAIDEEYEFCKDE